MNEHLLVQMGLSSSKQPPVEAFAKTPLYTGRSTQASARPGFVLNRGSAVGFFFFFSYASFKIAQRVKHLL